MDGKQDTPNCPCEIAERTRAAHDRQASTLTWLLGLGSVLLALSAVLLVGGQRSTFVLLQQYPSMLDRVILATLCCAFAIVQGAAIASWRIREKRSGNERVSISPSHAMRWLRERMHARRAEVSIPADASRHEPPRILSTEQIGTLKSACSAELSSFLEAMLLTGCRPRELAALRVSDFSPERLEVPDHRTGRPRRVPLTEAAQRFFERQIASKAPSDLVFVQRDGTPWRRPALARTLREACRRGRIGPPVRYRDVRHTFAARLIEAGMPLLYVSTALGDRSTTALERAFVPSPSLRPGASAPLRDKELAESVRTRLLSGEIPRAESELIWLFDGQQRCLVCGMDFEPHATVYEILKEDESLVLHDRCEAIRRSECSRLTSHATARERPAARARLLTSRGEPGRRSNSGRSRLGAAAPESRPLS